MKKKFSFKEVCKKWIKEFKTTWVEGHYTFQCFVALIIALIYFVVSKY